MRQKSIAVALIAALLSIVAGSGIACTTPIIEYDLCIRSTEGGNVTSPGEGRFRYCAEQGETVGLVATPDPGYRFVTWTGDVGTIANVNAPITTITVDDDYCITANFATPYNLTINSTEGGSVTTPGEGKYTYDAGRVVNLVATPDAGYRFVNWTGSVGTVANVNAATTTITMSNDYSITANFVKLVKRYNLTISSSEGGSVTNPGEGTFPFDEGTVVSLMAQADASYQFVNWTGDVSTVADVNAAITTITMNGDYTIAANFVDPPCGCG